MSTATREYKDRLFNFIFGSEEHKDWTLSLYNAVNGSDYSDAAAIQITTIKEALYLGMHNDVSFLIADEMNLYEQQSTYNPNIPLRLLQYAGNLYEKYLKLNKMNKYSSKRLDLPVPKLVVFYNGRSDQEDETQLLLSDSFPEGSDPDIEVRIRMLNINYGRNEALLKACEALKEYSWLIAEIRENQKTMETEEAVEKAILEMPTSFIVKSFLDAHRMEVKEMLLTEYNEAEQRELDRAEGVAEGMAKGEQNMLVKLVKRGRLTIQEAAEELGISEEDFAAQM